MEELLMETQRKKGKLFVFFLMKYNFTIVHLILIEYKALVMQCKTGLLISDEAKTWQAICLLWCSNTF